MCLQDLGVPTLKSANRHFLAIIAKNLSHS